MTRHSPNWFSLGLEGWMLGMEAAQVIWLRSWVIANGGAAGEREAQLMIEEKFAAHSSFGLAMLTAGALPTPEATTQRALNHYGRRVRANGRRLTRASRKS